MLILFLLMSILNIYNHIYYHKIFSKCISITENCLYKWNETIVNLVKCNEDRNTLLNYFQPVK